MSNKTKLSMSDLKTICINTAVKLFDLKNRTKSNSILEAKSRIIFPLYHNDTDEGKERISEQEARFLFIQELTKSYEDVFYSVETPTLKNYIFSKKLNKKDDSLPKVADTGGTSASTDSSIYNDDIQKPSYNIEFKAHNVSQKNITKDILKLIAEDSNGLFFHLLENVDDKTLTVEKNSEEGVIIKYKNAIGHIKTYNDISILLGNINSAKDIIFFICSLNPKFILCKKGTKKEILESDNFFDFKYNFKKKVQIENLNGWDFIDFTD